MFWVLGRFLRVRLFLVRLQATILLSCIVIVTWFVLWLLSRLNNQFVFIVIDTCFALWFVSFDYLIFLHCNWSLFCTLIIFYLNNLFFIIVIDTCFVLWLFYSSNNLFFIIVIDICEEILALWHIVKSWLRISSAYTCNTYSFQEHFFNRTLLVNVSDCLV